MPTPDDNSLYLDTLSPMALNCLWLKASFIQFYVSKAPIAQIQAQNEAFGLIYWEYLDDYERGMIADIISVTLLVTQLARIVQASHKYVPPSAGSLISVCTTF